MTRARRERLEAYVEQGDRDIEPVFVGRTDLFGLVDRNARAASRGNCRGRTICLPAGIGKTASLQELKKRSLADDSLLCVEVGPEEPHDPNVVFAAIADTARERWRPRTTPAEFFKDVRERVAKVGTPSLLVVDASPARQPAGRPAGFPWNETRVLLDSLPTSPAIAVLVDEAQQIERFSQGLPCGVLASLHRGPSRYSVPVFGVLAGLADTPERLENTISRFNAGNRQPLKPLRGSESRDYAARTLQWFRSGQDRLPPEWTPAAAFQRLAKWIDGECAGWPHHLRNAMAAVAEEHLRSDSMRLADLDGERIEATLSERRTEYYEDRLDAPEFRRRRVVGEVLDDLADGRLDRDGLEEAAARRLAAADVPEPGKVPAPAIAGDKLAEKMIEKGLVGQTHPGDDRRYLCPIANLRRTVRSGEHRVARSFPQFPRGGHAC